MRIWLFLPALLSLSAAALAADAVPVHEMQSGAVIGFIDVKHQKVFNALHQFMGSWDNSGTYDPLGNQVLDYPVPGALLGQTTVILPGRRHLNLAWGGENVMVVEHPETVRVVEHTEETPAQANRAEQRAEQRAEIRAEKRAEAQELKQETKEGVAAKAGTAKKPHEKAKEK